MKLITYRHAGAEAPGVLSLDGKTVFPFSVFGLDFADMNAVVQGLTDELRDEVAAKLPAADPALGLKLEDVTLQAPIPCPRQDVICLGINYMEHATEAEKFSKSAFSTTHTDAIYFSKRVNRAVADGEPIQSHTDLVETLDYEAELGVILKKDAKNVPAEKAGEYVFGYTVVNDVSARNVQTGHKQWYFGKSLDGFTPMGPCILTADEVESFPPELGIGCKVNGEVRQNSNTRLQIFKPDVVIAELSQGMTLLAGSIIITGTPSGVGMGMDPPCFLKPGDVVECWVEKIGSITNPVE